MYACKNGFCQQSPSGTFNSQLECENNCKSGGGGGECSECFPGSSGPCKDQQNKVCWAANPDGSCPPGTTKCS